MENPYSRAPLQVTLYDVPSGTPVRSYMFLGDAPRAVLEAARRGTPASKHAGRITLAGDTSAWPEAAWNKTDAATLQRYYGARWRWILTPRVGTATGPPCGAGKIATGGDDSGPPYGEVTGGDDGEAPSDFGSLEDFDDLDILIDEGALEGDADEAPAPVTSQSRGPLYADADWDPRTVYVGAAAYPEDTFADLKGKIYAATGVPPYRQHLFYPAGEDIDGDEGWERPTRTTYRLTVEGALVLADVRRLSQDLCAPRGSGDAVAGVPVDRRLEERKEDVRIDALDTFRTLEETPGVFVRRVFVADLASLLRARGAGMHKALSDRYQFDLLYYGLILKYWPALSPEAFRMAVADPAAIAGTFPLLDPPIEKVEAQLAAERKIIDQVYAQSKAQESRREREEKRGGLAVTEASVTVDPRAAKMPVNVRNVFDWIPATRSVPALIARIPPEAMEDWGGRGRRDYIVTKTHVSAESPRIASQLQRFLDRPPRRPGVAYAIVRDEARPGDRDRPRSQSAQPQFVYLTIYDDGRYAIESSWREDDRVGFKAVVRQLSDAAQPVIEAINAMGAAALPIGGTLETPAAASKGISSRASIGSLTVSAFWPHALTTEGFREMKARWREYEKAGIVGIRGLQQAGAYTFLFRKGITKYDPRAMERVVTQRAGPPSAGRQVVTNHYAYLTDPATAQRWQHVYAGRLVRVYHRTTDLRIEMVGVDMDEFRRIQLYVFVFLDSLVNGPNKLLRGVVQPGQARPTEGRLRSLQERDPDLYDLKKFDEGATVYSVLCQGDRQPEMVTPEEAERVAAKKTSKQSTDLVKYWNFTEGRPTYYRCPSKRFPHLSFRAGEHPLGYCLPCCKKTKALPGSKAQAINRSCLQNRLDADEASEDPLSVSRHVLSYGKAVPVGRISHVPRILSDGLFYDTIANPFAFRLIGVTQQTPTLPDAGYFYAVASALSLEADELVRDLADTAVALRESYRSLAEGGAVAFASAEDLAAAIVGTFLFDLPAEEALRFSPFGPGGPAARSWRNIIGDLVNIRYDVDVVEFVDEAGDGNVVFEASPTAAARLRQAKPPSGKGASRGTPADVAILVTSPAGTYPLAAMEQKEFLRHAYGRGPARRFFSSDYHEDEVPDRVVEILRDMAGSRPPPEKQFDLDFVVELCAAEKYRLLYRLVNLRDMCYGVVLAPDPARPDLVYFPVPYAPHYLPPPDPSRGPAPTALYGPRPPGSYPARALAKVLEAANRKAARGRGSTPQVLPASRLVASDGSLIGFIGVPTIAGAAASPGAVGLYFYHDPDAKTGLPWADAPAAAVPYDPLDVDQAIYEAGGLPARLPLPAEKEGLARSGLYRHRLYRLFLAEFAALLQDERNLPLRKELKALFARTRFSSASALADFRAELAAALRDFPDDADAIRALVATLYARVGPAALRKALDEGFDATAFDFDRSTLNRLRALGSRREVEAELGRLMRGQVELEGEAAGQSRPEGDSLENMYVACSLPTQVGRPQCVRERLRMPADVYSDYVSILAADILNPLKNATLGAMTAGVVDGSRFATRPGERVVIR